eukprot:7428560-Pyramimonas_sp.AAC.1
MAEGKGARSSREECQIMITEVQRRAAARLHIENGRIVMGRAVEQAEEMQRAIASRAGDSS